MCQTGSRKCAADDIDIDQLHYLNAECHFWVFNIYFYVVWYGVCVLMTRHVMSCDVTSCHVT